MIFELCRYSYCGLPLVGDVAKTTGYHPSCKEWVEKQDKLFPVCDACGVLQKQVKTLTRMVEALEQEIAEIHEASDVAAAEL